MCKVFTQTPDKILSNLTYMKCSDAATSNLQIFKSVRVRTRSRLWHVIKFIKGENAENERSWVMICYKNFRQKRWQGDCRYKKKLYKLTNSCVEMEVCMYVIHFWKLRSLFLCRDFIREFVKSTLSETSQSSLSRAVKVMKSQNEYLKSLHCQKYKWNIREISALEDYID